MLSAVGYEANKRRSCWNYIRNTDMTDYLTASDATHNHAIYVSSLSEVSSAIANSHRRKRIGVGAHQLLVLTKELLAIA
jgi:hypothetical protein